MIAKYTKENEDLVKKCSELENCVELLKCEYERCEDYWSSKLDDERQMFEQEQSQSSEKLGELIAKMAEYESQFAQPDEVDYRLPPIEEKYNLETQFTDLEQEFEDFKEHAEFQIAEKNNEIADLKEILDKSRTAEIGIQTTDPGLDLANKMRNLSNCVVESMNLFSADTMPLNWSVSGCNNLQQNSLDSQIAEEDVPMQRDYVNPHFVWQNNKTEKIPNTESTNMNIPWQSRSTSAESTSSTVTDNNSSPSKPKRSRRHDKSYQKPPKQGRRDSEEKTGAVGNPAAMRWRGVDTARTLNGEPTVQLPISAVHNLNGRLHHLEQRCRHLQMVLKQQHYHAEQMLNRKYLNGISESRPSPSFFS